MALNCVNEKYLGQDFPAVYSSYKNILFDRFGEVDKATNMHFQSAYFFTGVPFVTQAIYWVRCL